MKSFVPKRVRKILSDVLGVTALNWRIDKLEELLLESKDDISERSRTRWRQTKPDTALTWGARIAGDNFISKASSYGMFDPEKVILEIGPGYGRLLEACLRQKIPFKKYVAVDISLENVKYLRKTFPTTDVQIIHGDIEKASFEDRFDVILSSLTFKHLFPSFEEALRNVASFVNPGSMFFFDLIEGKKRYFEDDGVTYIRWYTRQEILRILCNVFLEVVAFDQIQHDLSNNFTKRLFVVARKPK